MKRIYLDNNATTPLDPKVSEIMIGEINGVAGNPSSLHWFGRQAHCKLIEARKSIASFFHSAPEEIIFTSGGTEGLNYLLRGLGGRGHVITTGIEHSAVYKTMRTLENQGLEATYLPVGLWGAPLPDAIQSAIRSDTKAMIFTLSNGETGVRIDLDAIAAIAEKAGIPLFLDGVSFIGKEPLKLPNAVKGLALSGHKFHGPQGIGLVLCRYELTPLLTGGGQEYHKRPGTENVMGIMGLAAAIQILSEEQTSITKYILELRQYFENGLLAALPNIQINGQGPRISNTSNIAFPGFDGERLLRELDIAGIAASGGSACSAKSTEPSRILTEMGINNSIARSSVRFSLSRMNTKEELDLAMEKIVSIVKKQ